MTPTSCTFVRWLADAEKKIADPPRTSSALPNGVSTESSATEPTTSRDIGGCLIKMSSRGAKRRGICCSLLLAAEAYLESRARCARSWPSRQEERERARAAHATPNKPLHA